MFKLNYFFKTEMKRPDVKFEGGNILNSNNYRLYTTKVVYDTFRLLLGPKQKYISNEKSVAISRGHLTPSSDFAFPDLMKATFQYVNVVPQFETINKGNWREIEKWVYNLTETGDVMVVTGTYGILELYHSIKKTLVKMYLNPTFNKIPIPKWMYKIIKTNTNIHVVVTYNNPFAQYSPAPICKREACPSSFNNERGIIFREGYTYCCDVVDFVSKVSVPPWVKSDVKKSNET